MEENRDGESGVREQNGGTPQTGDGLPWYVKAALAAAALVVLFVLVVDLVKFVGL
jgi:hypothetical protein